MGWGYIRGGGVGVYIHRCGGEGVGCLGVCQ